MLKKIAIAGIVLAVLLGVWAADSAILSRLVPGFSAFRSTSMEGVDIDWVGKSGKHFRMKIPRAYITRFHEDTISKFNGTSEAMFWIEMGLSDLKPRPAVTMRRVTPGTKEFEDDEKDIKDGVWIEFTKTVQSLDQLTVEANYQRRLDRELAENSIFLLPMEDGLLHYRDKNCNYRSPGCKGHDTFISPAPGPDWMILRCNPINEGPPGPIAGCEVFRPYNDEIFFTYMFRNTERRRQKEFEAGIRRLLSSFEAAANVK